MFRLATMLNKEINDNTKCGLRIFSSHGPKATFKKLSIGSQRLVSIRQHFQTTPLKPVGLMFSYITSMNHNATKCTFGHSDVTNRKLHKSGKIYFRNNTVFVIVESWNTKLMSFKTDQFSVFLAHLSN